MSHIGTFGCKAQTWADAEKVELPPIKNYESWDELCRLVNGYALCEELGIKWAIWRREKHAAFTETKKWSIPTVELLMLLFFAWRKTHVVGGHSEDFDLIDSILHELARRTNVKYETDFELRERVYRHYR